MKKVTKFLALLLALVLTMGLGVTAFADEVHAGNNGTITIDNAIKDQTYTIYEILYLESYDVTNNAYSYKATKDWSKFINSADITDKYVEVNDQGYVTWKAGASAAEFAEKAQAYAKVNNIANQGSKKAAGTTVEFTNLDLGYYLLDSSLGTLCSLDTTNPNVEIKEKNAEPANEKKVEEDSTGALGSKNDADIGQMVKFVSEVTLPAGSENVTFHDTMSAGLTLVKGNEGGYGVTVYGDAGLTDIIPDGNWPQIVPGKDGCTFEVDLSACVGSYKKVYVVYYAIVNEDAVVGNAGNPNQSWLSYGEEGTTTSTPSETKTYTWKINVYKYTMDGEAEKTLAGAVFNLSKNSDGTDPIRLVSKGNNVYRAATADDKATVTEITTDATGAFTIEGLDSDTYYLTEKTAPAGYNTLQGPITVVIDDKGEVTYNGTSTGTIKVLNKTGTELHSTGGVGTTVFYVLGGILAVGAAVLLVTKKRMEQA